MSHEPRGTSTASMGVRMRPRPATAQSAPSLLLYSDAVEPPPPRSPTFLPTAARYFKPVTTTQDVDQQQWPPLPRNRYAYLKPHALRMHAVAIPPPRPISPSMEEQIKAISFAYPVNRLSVATHSSLARAFRERGSRVI